MTFYQNQMPWKVVLTRKADNSIHTFYGSVTEYLQFDENLFTYQIYGKP